MVWCGTFRGKGVKVTNIALGCNKKTYAGPSRII